jgi:RNA polymerase sigma factor (sigma-70 family)
VPRVDDGDERRLIERAKSGDAAACGALVRAHYAAVYRLLAHLTRGDVHAAEDLCQDTFAAAWQKLGTFAGGSSFATWVHRIAYRRFLDWLRSSGSARQGRAPGDDGPGVEPNESRDPLAEVVAGEEARTLYAALDRLHDADRQVLVMHYLSGLSYRQMAEITDEPAGTVKWRTSAAVARLRTLLSDEMPDELERRSKTSAAAARPAAAADSAGA